jgi:hypothetical protein
MKSILQKETGAVERDTKTGTIPSDINSLAFRFDQPGPIEPQGEFSAVVEPSLVDRLRHRIAALVEIVRDSPAPTTGARPE